MNHLETTGEDAPYERLRALIVDGSLRPGESLSERGLSERLQVGRTPIREAIKWLARDGLLEIVPMRGTFVRQISVADLGEIHEMRLALESMAAYLAARHGPCATLTSAAQRLEEIAALAGAHQELDVDEAQRVGWLFHDAMFECTDNRRLQQSYRNLRDQSGLALQRVERYDVDRTRQAVLEHLEIYSAIVARDSEQARSLAWSHIENALQVRLKLLAGLGREH